MPDDDPLEIFRAAQDALQTSIRAAIQQYDVECPEELELMFQAHRRLEAIDHGIVFEEAKEPPVQGPIDRRPPQSS